MKYKLIKLLCFFFLFFMVNTFAVNAETEEVIVGFYEEYPYYYLDNKGNPQGYYYDIMKVIAEELNIDFRYENVTFNNYYEKLINKEIDLLFGVIKTEEFEKKFEYSTYIIANKVNYIFTNRNIEFGDLSSLNGLIFGYNPNLYNYKYFYDQLINNGINFEVKLAESNNQLKEWLKSGEIDFTVASGHDKFFRRFKDVYMYALGGNYIVANKDNADLINKIDNILININSKNSKKIYNLYNHYFNHAYNEARYETYFLIFSIVITISIFSFRKGKKILNQRKISIKYMNYLSNDKFKLFYQPIIDVRNNNAIGYEALLRLDNGEKILTPYYFLNEIEKLDIMYNITLWAIDKSLCDYNKLKLINNCKDNFYVSINISYKDLLNPNFINDVQSILKKYEKMKYYLCFEITERLSSNDFFAINKRIELLKKMGIIFAMDDFGIKYSNFDILQKIDYDIVKLDKIFIDGYEDSIKKQQILKAILDILSIYEKRVVIEGAETLEQIKLIKLLGEEKVYIQGYYYSNPFPIDDLKIK